MAVRLHLTTARVLANPRPKVRRRVRTETEDSRLAMLVAVVKSVDQAVLVLPQMFMNRGYVATVSGISKNLPKPQGLFDSPTNELTQDFEPVRPHESRARMERVAQS
jgi:hypothetical protein